MLKVTDPRKDMESIENAEGRMAGNTSSWVFDKDEFKSWRDDDTKKALWISGGPGKGQSMIALSLVKELSKSQENLDPDAADVILSYFFCHNAILHRSNALDMIKTLIRQIIVQRRDLAEHLLSNNGRSKSNSQNNSLAFSSLPALWKAL